MGDAVVLGVVVEDGFKEWTGDYPPCFVHHLLLLLLPLLLLLRNELNLVSGEW